MTNIKQLKQAVLRIEKKNKARNMCNRAFATLRANYGFTYQADSYFLITITIIWRSYVPIIFYTLQYRYRS